MTAEHILKSDVLDILFENRNKQYGAYELRRNYPNRVKKAISGMFLLVGLVAAAYVFGSQKNSMNEITFDFKDTTQLIDVDLNKKKLVEKPVEPPRAAAAKPLATVKNNIPEIVPDDKLIKTEVPPMDVIDTSAIGDENRPGEGTTNDAVISGKPGDGEGSGGEGDSKATVASEPVMPAGPIEMNLVDEMPEYPGGKMALVRYMVNNLTSELEPGVKYLVRVQFVINEEGKVSEAKVLSSDEASLNAQVLKAVNKMKTWKPGMMHGRKVAVRFTMPVTFMGPEE